MKENKKIFTSIILGLLVSACSTTSSNNTETTDTLESIKTFEQRDTESLVFISKKLADENAHLLENIASKNTIISSLEQQVIANETQIATLNTSLDEKDTLITALQSSTSNAKALAELEEEKKSRDELESQYAALNLANELLTRRISQLENENTSLKEQVNSLINTPSSSDGVQARYYNLLDQNANLQAKYANLEVDNTANYQQLITLKEESLALSDALSSARQQISKQENLNDTVKISEQESTIKLKQALSDKETAIARWKYLDNELAQAQQQNKILTSQLSAVRAELLASQSALGRVSLELVDAQNTLALQENDSISIVAAMQAIRSQMTVTLQNVEWLLPNENVLYDTFEILVSADVQPSFAGQTYSAELVTDSDTKMISNHVVDAVVQNGRLQWRWRVSGLNENADAQLNLFVSQQINIDGESIMRQVYRGNQKVSLINTNLFEKYGYWGIAILLGLLGGFFIGRINKSKNTL